MNSADPIIVRSPRAGRDRRALLIAISAGAALLTKVQLLGAFLGEKDFFLGYLTWADILFASVTEKAKVISFSLGIQNPLAAHQNLTAHYARVVALPGVAAVWAARKSVIYTPPSDLPFQVVTLLDIEASQK